MYGASVFIKKTTHHVKSFDRISCPASNLHISAEIMCSHHLLDTFEAVIQKAPFGITKKLF